jgi:spermidine/putrescine transport system permease protein
MGSARLTRLVYVLYIGTFLSFLYLPLLVVALLAFNANPMPAFPWKGFTLGWFGEVYRDPLMMGAIGNSVLVGLGVVALSVPIGVAAAFLLVRYDFAGKGALYALVLSPLITPGVILGVSMLIFFSDLGLQTGLGTTVLGQSSFIISFVLLIVSARLQKFDPALEEAAQDLGATPLRAVWRVTLPFLRPAIVAACAVAFLLSFDNFNTTLFLIGNSATLPIRVYSAVRLGLSPKINAVSVVFILLTVSLGLLVEFLRTEKRRPASRPAEILPWATAGPAPVPSPRSAARSAPHDR